MSRLVVGKLILSSGLQVPNVTSANRPVSPISGSIIFNTTTNKFEKWNGSSWVVSSGSSLEATGGTIAYYGPYKIHIFTTVGSSIFNVTSGSGEVEYLIVAGGGGGGMDMGGGGGGGGVLQGKTNIVAGPYPVVVGRGGYGAPAGNGGFRTDGAGPQPNFHQFTIPATKGENSSALGLTAIGGGLGGSSYFSVTTGANILPGQGGSGGGASGYSNDGTLRAGGAGTPGQGYNGGRGGGAYYSGGGGGAGGKGYDSNYLMPHGGPGVACDILGTRLYWGGGGGGAAYSAWQGGNGGVGGGGGGAVGYSVGGDGLNPGIGGNNGNGGGSINSQTNIPGGNAGANTGGGGGGGSHYNANNKGGEGGSGIVVIRYRLF
jgi:hypothetical protein